MTKLASIKWATCASSTPTSEVWTKIVPMGEVDFVSVLALNGTAHNNTENWTFPLFVVRLSLTLIPLLANLNTNI